MCRKFFESELGPHAYEIDMTDKFPGFRDFMVKCGEMGFHGMTVPEVYGGTDMGYLKVLGLKFFFCFSSHPTCTITLFLNN